MFIYRIPPPMPRRVSAGQPALNDQVCLRRDNQPDVCTPVSPSFGRILAKVLSVATIAYAVSTLMNDGK